MPIDILRKDFANFQQLHRKVNNFSVMDFDQLWKHALFFRTWSGFWQCWWFPSYIWPLPKIGHVVHYRVFTHMAQNNNSALDETQTCFSWTARLVGDMVTSNMGSLPLEGVQGPPITSGKDSNTRIGGHLSWHRYAWHHPAVARMNVTCFPVMLVPYPDNWNWSELIILICAFVN